MSASLQPHGSYSPWNSPGQNTGVDSLSLRQGIFPTQGSNPGLPHCGQILYQLEPQGKRPNTLLEKFCLFTYFCLCWVFAVALRLSLVAVSRGPLCWAAWPSHCGGSSCPRVWALGAWASLVVVPGLSCSEACEIFPDHGWNLCSVHWQADSCPLGHQWTSPEVPEYSLMIF